VNHLAGIGYKMPLTMGAFSVAALSMIGLPLFSGFISKWGLAQGSIEAGIPMFVGLIVLSGLLNATYFLPIIWQAFFVEEKQARSFAFDRIPKTMSVTLVILALCIIYFGVRPDFLFNLATQAATVFLP